MSGKSVFAKSVDFHISFFISSVCEFLVMVFLSVWVTSATMLEAPRRKDVQKGAIEVVDLTIPAYRREQISLDRSTI